MNIYEHLLPGKENALTPEYLATKYHFSSVRMLQKQIEAERNPKSRKAYQKGRNRYNPETC